MAGSSEADDARIKRIEQILNTIGARELPSAELAKLERELDAIGRVLDPSLEGSKIIIYSEMEAFVERLKSRQGTIMPDFPSLYKKKAALDRKICDPHDP